MSDDIIDIMVVGAGPAGLAAGLYGARSGSRTVVIDGMYQVGGQAAVTESVENYPGFDFIGGPELSEKMAEHAKKFGAEIRLGATVKSLAGGGDDLPVVMTSEGEIQARSVVLATGAQPRKLGVPGEDEFRGKGVSYCATCDANFFKGQHVAVIGGGDTAVEEGTYLAKIVDRVTLVHRRDSLRAGKVVQDRAFAKENISYQWNSTVKSIEGDAKVSHLVLDTPDGEQQLECAGVFIFVGYLPNGDYVGSSLDTDEWGYIVTDIEMGTSRKGFWAAGDIRSKAMRQVVNAAGEGATAAFHAARYVDEQLGRAYPGLKKDGQLP